MRDSKKLTLTIVIPVYNEENYLKACLDAIAAQTKPPDEILVIDNNSTDKSLRITRKYKNVKILKEPRQGVHYATTTGFKAATSDIIGRIDADTILPPDWVETVIFRISTWGLDATTGPVYYYDMPLPRHNFWFDHFMRRWTHALAPGAPFLYGSNMAFRRESWQKIASGLCDDEDVHEDIDIAIHLREAGGKIGYSKKLLAGASGRRYNDSVSSFMRYLAMYRHTYHKHGIKHPIIYPAIFMWGLGYVLVHPWRNQWYSLHNLFNKNRPFTRLARKNPMSKKRG